MGWGVAHIPWHHIVEYTRFYGLDQEEAEEFLYLIRQMDKAYVEYNSEKIAAEART